MESHQTLLSAPINGFSVSCPLCHAPVGESCRAVQEGQVLTSNLLGMGNCHLRRLAKADLDPRRGRYVVTRSGRRVYLTDSEPQVFILQDIAHGLANLCRFHGQTHDFYSVAEHSVVVARQVTPSLRLTALMHDAAEAYTGDIPQPLKRLVPGFDEVEDGLMTQISRRFGFCYPVPEEVKYADKQVSITEMFIYTSDRFYDPEMEEIRRLPFSVVKLGDHPLDPVRAERLFIKTFEQIMAGGI